MIYEVCSCFARSILTLNGCTVLFERTNEFVPWSAGNTTIIIPFQVKNDKHNTDINIFNKMYILDFLNPKKKNMHL